MEKARKRSKSRPPTAGHAQDREVEQISGDIMGQIYMRDFKMVDQSDMIVSYVPQLPNGKPGLSSGVERELHHAFEGGKEVYVIWACRGMPSPFITETATKVFRTLKRRWVLQAEGLREVMLRHVCTTTSFVAARAPADRGGWMRQVLHDIARCQSRHPKKPSPKTLFQATYDGDRKTAMECVTPGPMQADVVDAITVVSVGMRKATDAMVKRWGTAEIEKIRRPHRCQPHRSAADRPGHGNDHRQHRHHHHDETNDPTRAWK
jgi:hypothetical protein